MAKKEVLQERIVDTSLGTLKVSLIKIIGFDVDEICSQRTQSEGIRRRLFEIGQDASVENNKNTVFPTDFIPSEEEI